MIPSFLPPSPMDKFDQRILALLRQDARMPVSRIAEEVSLSRPAVSERIQRLERSGVIRGYHARVAPAGESSVKAFFEIFHQQNQCQDYVERLGAFPEVRHCYGISGETDMLIQVEAATMQRVNEILEQIERFPGIRRVRTHMVIRDWPF